MKKEAKQRNNINNLGFILLSLIFIVSCSRAHMKPESPVEPTASINNIDQEVLEKKALNGLFIKDYIGRWKCYKYILDNKPVEDIDLYPETFAKEFSKYVFFDILVNSSTTSEDSINYILSGVGVYNTPIVDYAQIDKVTNDTLYYIAPSIDYDDYRTQEYSKRNNQGNILPFYGDAPLNRQYLFLIDEFVMSDKGYRYFFKKDDSYKKDSSVVYGVPGDGRNRFLVEKLYADCSIAEVINKFRGSFPYGAEIFLDDVQNMDQLMTYKWDVDLRLRLEQYAPIGKFVIVIERKDKDFYLKYYTASDYENDEGDDGGG